MDMQGCDDNRISRCSHNNNTFVSHVNLRVHIGSICKRNIQRGALDENLGIIAALDAVKHSNNMTDQHGHNISIGRPRDRSYSVRQICDLTGYIVEVFKHDRKLVRFSLRRIRTAKARHIFNVMTHAIGAMTFVYAGVHISIHMGLDRVFEGDATPITTTATPMMIFDILITNSILDLN